MISLEVIVGRIFPQRPSQRCFTKEDQPIEAFGFDRTHEALSIGVEVRRSRRQSNDRRSRFLYQLTEVITVFGIAINDEFSIAVQHTNVITRHVPGHLQHPNRIGIDADTGDLNGS